jgi:hypothetical protein
MMHYAVRPESSVNVAQGNRAVLLARLSDPAVWLVPTWAALCGVAASNGFAGRVPDLLRAADTLLLAAGAWVLTWMGLSATEWIEPLKQWRSWNDRIRTARVPYQTPGSPSERAGLWLAQLISWAKMSLLPSCGYGLLVVSFSIPSAFVLAARLGNEALMLTVALVAATQLALVWMGGSGTTSSGWESAFKIAFPWLAGHLAFGSLSLPSFFLAITLAAVWWGLNREASSRARSVSVGLQLVLVALLVSSRRPVHAALMSVLIAPQAMLLPLVTEIPDGSWFLRHSAPWVALGMLVSAVAL